MRILALIAAATLALPVAAQAQMAPDRTLTPSESVWKPAPTPPGGVDWAVLESTKEITRKDEKNLIRSKPVFPDSVKKLAGKRVKVNGYMLPLQNGTNQTHFVLLAYPPDCPFHLNPLPMQFIEVRAETPVKVSYDVRTIEGVLTLHGEDEQGIFYKFTEAKEAS
ncbi:MAG: DUF3299 domain-containing protein [Polymorphobacter sp.]|uniref:DUF3299 domain-containing protein n=1 Tax=Polymorphobacter sp. TaxID=1909290 RepID=UPI003A8409EB